MPDRAASLAACDHIHSVGLFYTMKKKPWFKLYPTVWLGDPHLKLCKWPEKGLLSDLMAIAHDGVPRGTLTNGGLALTIKDIAKAFGESHRKTRRLMKILYDKHRIGFVQDFDISDAFWSHIVSKTTSKQPNFERIVASNSSQIDGVWHIPSMVRETLQSKKASEDGKQGGNDKLKKNSCQGVNPEDKPRDKPYVEVDVEVDVDPPNPQGKKEGGGVDNNNIKTHVGVEKLALAYQNYSEKQIADAWTFTLQKREEGDIRGTMESCFMWALREGKYVKALPKNKYPCPQCKNRSRPEMKGCQLCSGTGNIYMTSDEHSELLREMFKEKERRENG